MDSKLIGNLCLGLRKKSIDKNKSGVCSFFFEGTGHFFTKGTSKYYGKSISNAPGSKVGIYVDLWKGSIKIYINDED